MGEKPWANRLVSPARSAIFKKPSQAHMLPNRNMDSSTASPAPSITAWDSSGSRPLTVAQTTLRAIIPNQI